jgi:response regulator RpfG family c-di-GMP phosphodiesterase
MRLLLVDDDARLRELVRTTFELVDVEVMEADSVAAAERLLGERRPDVIVLDLRMPGEDGAALARRLKADRETRAIPIVLLTGDPEGREQAAELGADSVVTKPFSPLQLLGLVEYLAGGIAPLNHTGAVTEGPEGPDAQLLLYARDLRHLLEIERSQRALLQAAYRETVTALAGALETKDVGTRRHSQRVQRYALELTRMVEPDLEEDPSLEYGFLLHDVGKIGIPDRVLNKPGPLDSDERKLMQRHTIMGEQLLSGMALLRGEGVRVVRSHHERWDGSGYPDALRGGQIPLGARIFAVADALDAMTSDRPYRAAVPWGDAASEIDSEAGRQFDPAVVAAFEESESRLHAIGRALTRT